MENASGNLQVRFGRLFKQVIKLKISELSSLTPFLKCKLNWEGEQFPLSPKKEKEVQIILTNWWLHLLSKEFN